MSPRRVLADQRHIASLSDYDLIVTYRVRYHAWACADHRTGPGCLEALERVRAEAAVRVAIPWVPIDQVSAL